MTCNDGLQASDVNSTPIVLILGAVKRVSLNVYQKDGDSDLSNCGGCVSASSIVIPPTITIVGTTIDIYLSPDADTPILTGAGTVTDIFDDDAVLIGFKISYVIDTTAAPLNAVGEYMLVISYETSTGEIYPNIMYFNVFKQAFVSGC